MDFTMKASCLFLAVVTTTLASDQQSPLVVDYQQNPTTSIACGSDGRKHPSGYHGPITMVSGNLKRNFSINVPDTYTPNHHWPLIIDYHGNFGTSRQQYENSQYYLSEHGQEYLVVYPQGLERHWQGASYAVEGVDDLTFTTDLLAHLSDEYCINHKRIYASGKSNGGGFVDTLACSDNGDAFAAFAMASAALYTDNKQTGCNKTRAILESHGDLDTIIPYGGNLTGRGGATPPIAEWVSWWGERDCPGAQAKQTGDLGGYDVTTYSCPGLEDVVTHYQVYDLGHCWPSSTGLNEDATRPTKPGKVPQHCAEVRVLDYTSVVLDWFARWTFETASGS